MHTEEHRTEEHHIEILHGNDHAHDSHGEESSEETSGNNIIKWIVVAGVLIVLLIASITIVKFIPKAISKLSGAAVFLGKGDSGDLTVSSNPGSVRSENIFFVTWKGKEYETEVTRSVSFKCVSGINIEYKSTNGMRPVICDTVFPLPKETSGSFPFSVTSLVSEKTTLDYVVAITDTLENKVVTSASGSVDVYPKGVNALLSPVRKAQAQDPEWKPRLVFLGGNHEFRLVRHVEANPELHGFLSYDNLRFKEFGWEVYDFLEPVVIGGVTFIHYFPHPMTGKPLGGNAMNILKTVGGSIVQGHRQTLDVATRTLHTGVQQWSIIAGASYDFDESYKGFTGNKHHRGIVVMHNVENGGFDPLFINIEYLKKRFA